MRISLNWLKDFVTCDEAPEKLSDDLSLFGFETKEIIKIEDDNILDIEITPNRGDCLSHLGIAREIAAMYDLKLKIPYFNLEIIEEDLPKAIHIKFNTNNICPRFTTRIIDNLKVKESPDWLKNRLISYGFRPINNIVDVTNYVMIAMGQPLHAFDYNKINHAKIHMYQALGNEELTTLDGKKRSLPKGAIIISDDEKIYDLAGIMGGLNSEVSDWTRTIILQGAVFDPVMIRKASKQLGLTTDASYRYERGVDLEATCDGLNYAIHLLKLTSPEVKVGKLVDKRAEIAKQIKVSLPIGKVNKLLGTNLNEKQSVEILKRNNFQIVGVSKAENQISVGIPSYRHYDIKIWQDLVEEIARIYGYNNIYKKNIESEVSNQKNLEWLKRENIKNIISDLGFTEFYSYSFQDKDKIFKLLNNVDSLVEIANPLSDETRFLRPSILPSILAQIAKNPWAPENNVFEIGKVYFEKKPEKWLLTCATSSKSDAILKKVIDKLQLVTKIKNVDNNILKDYKIRKNIKYLTYEIADIDIKPVNLYPSISKNKFIPISKYSPTVRDLAFIVDKSDDPVKILNLIKKTSDNIFIVELFDKFELPRDKYGKNKINLAFHIWLQDFEKPLDEDKTTKILDDIINKIKTNFNAELRKQGE